ncbi:hypothetical protein EJD97_005435 [Solanum chilense]|uniref:Uncharacterized protein n=1 Tax=Solanum chilense TaxID=4083 RepID=A0A6N2BUC7_SOLCI|nr:hypothetical protein EJD97_005435 [Solanum chilense]
MARARKTSYFTLALFVYLLIITTQLISCVNCRSLREKSPKNIVAAASQDDDKGRAEIVKRSRQSSVKNMAFIMVSGPSRKGPGH